MTDSRLQQLHRAWLASQDVEDEAAWLLERVRVGELSQERLELVAALGHRGASSALGKDGAGPQSLEALTAALQPTKKRIRALAALQAAKLVLENESPNDPELTAKRRLLGLLEEWVETQSPELLPAMKHAGWILLSKPTPGGVYECAAGTAWTDNPQSAWLAGTLQFASVVVGEDTLVSHVTGQIFKWALYEPTAVAQ